MTKTCRFLGLGLATVAAALLAPSAAFAQAQGGPNQMPLAKAVVSNEVAARTLFKYQISATVARQIVDACVEFARNQQGGPGNYAIFVLAPNGDIVDAHVVICARRAKQVIVTSDTGDLKRLDSGLQFVVV